MQLLPSYFKKRYSFDTSYGYPSVLVNTAKEVHGCCCDIIVGFAISHFMSAYRLLGSHAGNILLKENFFPLLSKSVKSGKKESVYDVTTGFSRQL